MSKKLLRKIKKLEQIIKKQQEALQKVALGEVVGFKIQYEIKHVEIVPNINLSLLNI